jgi:chromosome segregation ATPase
MTNDNNEIIALSYIQKQEQFILDMVRKNLNLEVHIVSLNNKISECEKLYKESQNNVLQQNDLMNQAAVSIKELTEKKDKYEKLKNDYSVVINEKNSLIEQNKELNRKINELLNEINRQNDEMKTLYDENQDLVKKITKEKNKK